MLAKKEYQFLPSFFKKDSLEGAKSVILSPIAGASTDVRWQLETDFTLDLIERYWNITSDSIILDYGCGVGRMAKALIDKYGCYVVGIDTEPMMQVMSIQYVYNYKFIPCSHLALNKLNVTFDYALGIWVLLHAVNPLNDIAIIKKYLKPGGGLLVINETGRRIPTTDDIMVDDGLVIADVLNDNFKTIKTNNLDYFPTNQIFTKVTWWGMYEKEA